AAELELAQVVVELAPGRVEVARRFGPVAVALRTKALTAAHRRGLVLSLAAGDLPAASERTRDPAATEGATAVVAGASADVAPDGEDLVSSEDPVADKTRALAFADKAKEKNSVEIDKRDPNRAILLVGNDDFPLPIPIVKRKGKWSFDTKVGREEILNRRIGANELNAIEICRGFVEAQHEYAQEKHDDSKVNQYAQHILSTPGKH